MSINFDRAFGIHDDALFLRARRAEMLSSNLANADTPNYKARDIDFKTVLNQVQGDQQQVQLRLTNASHIAPEGSGIPGGEALYRIPHQPSLDGNTVDAEQEQAAFSENALHYQASLSFLSGRISGLLGAIKGE